jgi:putative transposase
MSDLYHSLSHSKWDCKYHVIFIPKGRKKLLFGKIRLALGKVFHELARQKECTILQGHLMQDHVHMLIEIPPKHQVSSIIGFLRASQPLP